MYLTLPIPPKNSAGVSGGPVYLDECLEKFSEIEILDGNDAWHCPKCKMQRTSRKMLSIARLPPILLIHLKRFYYQGPFKNKIETYVDFPLKSLDLSRFISDGRANDNLNKGAIYDLYAISVNYSMSCFFICSGFDVFYSSHRILIESYGNIDWRTLYSSCI